MPVIESLDGLLPLVRCESLRAAECHATGLLHGLCHHLYGQGSARARTRQALPEQHHRPCAAVVLAQLSLSDLKLEGIDHRPSHSA
jgi:hypothetical protein